MFFPKGPFCLSRDSKPNSPQTPRIVKTLPKGTSDDIVLLQNILSNFNQPRLHTHDWSSKATTSSSLPLTTSEAGASHTGQWNH